MKKYLAFFKVNLSIYFVYRLGFILWRVRSILNFMIIYFLWTSVYGSRTNLFSYDREQMITYILCINILTAITLSTRTTDIASEIVDGSIINYLTKPISFIGTVVSKELSDKLINTVSSLLEISLFIFLLSPEVIIQKSIIVYPFFILSIAIGSALAFFMSLSLSFIAFWTAEVWAPRFIYFILMSLLAGTFFPLDILPKYIHFALLATPFPYLIYSPMKIYLTGINPYTLFLLFMSIIWCFILFFLMKKIWGKGIKEFSFYGK